MINVDTRNLLAKWLHEFIAGFITNYDLEHHLHFDLPVSDSTFVEHDSLLKPLRDRMWLLCFVHGDLDEYRLTGEYKLPPECRRDVLRWIMFLQSDREYKWPVFQVTSQMFRDAGIIHPLLSLITLGFWGRRQRRKFDNEFERFMQMGDYDVWPFMQSADFEASYLASCPLTISST